MLGLGWLALAGYPLLGVEPAAMPATAIEFTAEERAWMAAHPVIRVGHDPTYEPYAIQEKDGTIVGLDPDYFALYAERTGLKFQHEVRKDWGVMMEAFKAREVDVLPSLGKSVEREQFLIYTQAYAYAPSVIITRNDSRYLFSLQDLSGKTVSIPIGYAGLRGELNASAPGNTIVEYENSLECYRAVERGEVFASIGDVANASWLIKGHQLTGLRLGSVILNQSDIFMGVRKDWPMLAQILNKTMASVTAEDRQKINQRWIMVDYAADRWWVTAFKIAAGVAAAAILVFIFVVLHNRSLARELNERRRIQAELELVRDKLEQASTEKSEFMHMVAHDLRSPLTGILLNTDLLQYEVDPTKPAIQETIGQIRNSTRQMMRLTNDLVDVHMLEEGKRDFIWAEVDFNLLLHEAVAGYSERAARKKIQLRLDCEPRVHALRSDASALRQIADNLISNALKYSPSDSEVLVSLRAVPAGYRLTIRDQGPGIAPADQEKLFQKYVRGTAQPTGGEKATGLGLWIVRRFVEGLHGRVWYEPGPGGKGTDFVVEVPLAPPPAG
jgi:polar amino acid transport system substrate-binding protein